MIFDVKSLGARKSLETGHPEIEWLRALESARQSLKLVDIDYRGLELIALASRSPAKFTVMARLIYQYGKSHPNGSQVSDLLLDRVNASPFALSDWIDAIDRFYGWLIDNERKVDFLPMLEYLDCCVASPDAREGGHTLAGLLDDMLQVAGYEG